MNIKEIKEMINLMNENNLNELEIEKEGTRIKLKRGNAQEIQNPAPVIIEKTTPLINQPTTTQKTQETLKTNTVEIKAPMVGTFYRAPSPEAQPFVEIGQVVSPKDTVCIIEAMKLMNEIKAEIKGKIVEILIENAQPIEFGQPLFIIEPA
ncbi:MAG: acetyl-CoA carboxylase biotin carboxyl carrier protein [Candidatus Omnitrophota bacterium]